MTIAIKVAKLPRMDQKKSLKFCIDVIGAQDANGNLDFEAVQIGGVNGDSCKKKNRSWGWVFCWRFFDPLKNHYNMYPLGGW